MSRTPVSDIFGESCDFGAVARGLRNAGRGTVRSRRRNHTSDVIQAEEHDKIGSDWINNRGADEKNVAASNPDGLSDAPDAAAEIHPDRTNTYLADPQLFDFQPSRQSSNTARWRSSSLRAVAKLKANVREQWDALQRLSSRQPSSD